MIKRRDFLFGMGAFGIASASRTRPATSQSILTTFGLRLQRRNGFAEISGMRTCIFGTLHAMNNPVMPGTSVDQICHTYELAFRNNLECISSVAPGSYNCSIRTDGPLGWRIVLPNTQTGRREIRIHTGNISSQSTGCILVGTAIDESGACGCVVVDQAPPFDDCGHGRVNPTQQCDANLGQTLPITGSQAARNEIKLRYGNDTTRPILLVIAN